jgi:ubiquinone biosynthesis monooxygenase Coq7
MPARPGGGAGASRLAEILRVDHAGEVGATRIYAGQLAVLGRSRVGDEIRRMAEQEIHHRDVFDRMIVARRVRPTALRPLAKLRARQSRLRSSRIPQA